MNPKVTKLLDIAYANGALKTGKFILSSGKESHYYFDGRLLSLDPEGINLIADLMLELIAGKNLKGIGGPTLAADPIVSAVCTKSFDGSSGVPGFIVRKEAKQHGMSQLIEGSLKEGTHVAIVDDTCTTGGSLFHAIEAAESQGAIVDLVMVVLDRNEGGSAEVIGRGYEFKSLIYVNDEGEFVSDI
ncbi:MAG: orotate phosphoribosyltransferase [Dehalococcoidia bacterium]|mgnify:FL=1|jgi:orotate phosphoribosyltransferase|nr:orotate phosphoribosyltransferase [Dehalococcoidia bacterium]MBN40560.1 orotate phosphoribosyltransferase [Chloroflexota bacterium]MQG08650.1 orotate phosphoribosyltransferase [SAR202 cluster bacterium]MQG17908.1 orotate phosphoribosyltransferase [SAR202 cluster bacterium]MQG26321.1 orotate phosphoribosyltransferase [SAR202 cluster bacterium]|tara:strand:+ start:17610 stop:18170 length:561 start_codon:yes stop_codon:yes gene_type:complete